MSLFRSRDFWSILGLVLLGMVSAALSLAAIGFGSSTDTGAATEAPSYRATESSEEQSSPAATVEPEPTEPETESEETESEEELENSKLTVVMGDSNSLGDVESIWLGSTMEELGWDSVQNLSAPGRGYVAVPRECENSPCASFPGTVEAIVEFQPDVVVTFGGVADGDVPITEVAAQYYSDIRSAMPDVQIIAISPVYTGEAVPDWAPLHRESIRVAVESVGGTFIDVGQPALGDGGTMSAESHAEVAQAVIDTLRE